MFCARFFVTLRAMDKNAFDAGLARSYCMQYGLVVGLLASASFLFTMYGPSYPIFGLMGPVFAIIAFVAAIRLIRGYQKTVAQLTFSQTCYMVLFTYLFAIILTAAVQYVYLAWLDQGRLLTQVEEVMAMPEYKAWFDNLSGGDDKELMKELTTLMGNPARMTFQLLWTNCILSLILIIPTAILAKVRK